MPPIDALRQASAYLRRRCASLLPGDAQEATQRLGGGRHAGRLRIDAAFRLGATTLVAGWCIGDYGIELRSADGALRLAPRRIARPEVAQRFGLAADDRVGFAFVLEGDHRGDLQLAWTHARPRRCGAQPLAIACEAPTHARAWRAVAPLLLELVLARAPFSREWTTLVQRLGDAPAPDDACLGYLERAIACAVSGRALAVGWCAEDPGAVFWLESDDGTLHPLTRAQRHFRDDVFAHMRRLGSGARPEAGFGMVVEGIAPGQGLRLRALRAGGAVTLGRVRCERLPNDLLDAATELAALDLSAEVGIARIDRLEAELLAPLIAQRRRDVARLPVQSFVAGTLPAAPVASVVVPLYARRDFVEHQLLALQSDAAFARRCELIYVIDDPRLLAGWKEDAAALAQSYGLPMRWVWGGANRGFAGASNLGAACARGRHLVFMNSDVFPLHPGWAERLCAALDADPKLGAVGPRLLNPDGSIHHAGMEFRHRADLGHWINHHPGAGLGPEHDRHQQLTHVVAVTGACIAVRRADFEAVGGWDDGYLIGDFEDSDLCLKLQAQGLAIGYMPQVELTHLVRQSMKTLGDLRLRRLVTTYNALRHQQRWPAWFPQDEVRAQADARVA